MEKLLLTGLLALFIFGVTPVNAQSRGKEEYITIEGTSDEIGASLNKYAQQGWKVRAATTEYFVPRNDAHIFVILYREAE